MSSSNHIKNVALVGATGFQGKHIAAELLKRGTFNITAITRSNSTTLPAGITPAVVDYNDHASIVAALRGQDVIIITLSVRAPPDTHQKLVDAAADAGVKLIVPNEWGYDAERDPEFTKNTIVGEKAVKNREHIRTKGIPFIGVNGGFWYEFSLGGDEARYGFDFNKNTLTIFDEGNIKISTSTWEQVARGVAGVLSLKINPDGPDDKSPTVSSFYNQSVCVESFNLSQKDMFESVKRVTGTTDADWTVTHENSKERYGRAMGFLAANDFHLGPAASTAMRGLGMAMYTCAFFPNSPASMPDIKNEVLGLPKEDLDACTKKGIEYGKAGGVYGGNTDA
ncbi:hypothetical protein Dda_3684 [Drechslerella dactyloides]|uniref:NmrA-like domain-containing protein n=1 Tax=Drechslerella dactyloides TaxID=74499 RepID=A0AAD6IZX3_DREDA|nr:hypothetical protein Dda_3684 [Drechslerella dactyloides]